MPIFVHLAGLDLTAVEEPHFRMFQIHPMAVAEQVGSADPNPMHRSHQTWDHLEQVLGFVSQDREHQECQLHMVELNFILVVHLLRLI